jgi:WD40 repeat protein
LFSPNAPLLAATEGKRIVLWDPSTGKRLLTLTGHSELVLALAFDPAGALLASGDSAGEIRVWELATGRAIYTLSGHTHKISALRFAEAGNLISAAADGTVRVWPLE